MIFSTKSRNHPLGRENGRNGFVSHARAFFCLLFLAFLFSQSSMAQAPCNAHRWQAGDGWRYNATTQKWEAVVTPQPNDQPKGIVRCASSAETESGLEAFKAPYNSAAFPIDPTLTDCFNQNTELRGTQISGPTQGEDIVWFNFDIRQLAGTYQFQIITNQVVGWALYYSNDLQPTTATGTVYPPTPPGLSGNCTNLAYADCGLSGNGWSTITVPSFTSPTNYYLAMWVADPQVTTFPESMNLTFKARFGCGGSTCFLAPNGNPALTCTANSYQVCQTYDGSAGRWKITDNTNTATSFNVTTYDQNGVMVENYTAASDDNLYLELGTVDGTGTQSDVKAVICATYPLGQAYSITFTPSGIPAGAPNDYVACTSGNTFNGVGMDRATAPTGTASSPGCGQTNGSIAVSSPVAGVTYTLLQGGNPTGVAYSNGTFSPVPPNTGYTIRASKTGSCDNTSDPITVNSAPVCGGALCTYTQGAYGSTGGKMCDGKGNRYSTLEAIRAAIGAWPDDKIVLGTSARSIVVALADAPKVLEYLPGGGKSAALKHGGPLRINTIPPVTPNFRTLYTSTVGKNRYKINNTLLAQTLTLALNMGFSSGLSGFTLEGNKYLVTANVTGCGSNTMVPCSYRNTWIRTDVVAKLGNNKTVRGLLDLANRALGGENVGVSLDAIASVVDAINNAFDGCKLFVRYAVAPVSCDAIVSTSTFNEDKGSAQLAAETKLSVTAYPNPYSDKLRFVITSPVSGQATLELYNMLGQKVRMIYRGNVLAGINQVVEYNVPIVNQGNLLYILRVNDKQVDGKLFHTRQ